MTEAAAALHTVVSWPRGSLARDQPKNTFGNRVG
jgi:hypothetical protein